MNSEVYGVVEHPDSNRKTDYLYRLSIKGIILNDAGEILFVKESGRDWWDLPGGGMDHGESIKEALARELREEVSLMGDFTYTTILAEDPRYLSSHNLYQVRLTFLIEDYNGDGFVPGDEGDEVMFIDPATLKDSQIVTEQKIYEYSQVALANRSRP